MNKLIALRNGLRVIGASAALVLSLGAGVAYANIDIDGGNSVTGPNSENENEWEIENEVDVDIDNKAHLDNDQKFFVSTGYNDVEYNTQVGDISTGDIWGEVEVENALNYGDISLALGDPLDVDIDLMNEKTGPNSENENEVKIESEIDIDIDNDAHIDNDLWIKANTGKNDVENNTVVGDISTGDIRIEAEVKNIANKNAGSIDLGNIGELSVSADLENSVTGPFSSNENEVNVKNEIDVDIDNEASIDNDVSVSANTGGNSVENNTCVGDISTGDVRFDVSTTNVAN